MSRAKDDSLSLSPPPKKKRKYKSIYMLMVGGKKEDRSLVWCIKQLNQDLSDSCSELPADVPRWTGSSAVQVHVIVSILVRVK